MSCCVTRVDGEPTGGGGIPPFEEVVYEIDFRTLPTQDFADGAVVLGDRTWTCGGRAQALTWGIVNGVGLTGTVTNSATNIWTDAALDASRIQIALGTIDPNYDPMSRYGWEIEQTANNSLAVGVSQSRAILGLVKRTATEPGTEQCACGTVSGMNSAAVNGAGMQNATTTAPMVTAFAFPAYSVMRICNQPVVAGCAASYVAPPGVGSAWPVPSTYRGCGFVSPTTGLANLTTTIRWGEHPDHELHVVMASTSGLGFGLTFSRLRIVRFIS